MVDLQTISLIVQIIGVSATATAAVVGVSSYINSNKRAEEAKKKEQATQELALKAQQQNLETRQAQLFMDIYDKISQEDFQRHQNKLRFTDTSDITKLFLSSPNDEFMIAMDVFVTYMEGVGVLVKEGLLNIKYVALLMSGLTLKSWEKYESFIREARIRWGLPRYASEFEYLHGSLVAYIVEHPELSATQ